ncbi:Card1-like endonuclease domain-containing protein [Enterovibrio sp. 27052020O]|uniref:Card1-like endonuclease domain-containing protein n=1 Tax=Enterovibrio sp. 27052020O TaxID=3241166 RepID=UPI00388D6D90
MAIHVGIIDQDPVRLVTALLHRKFKAEKVIFIGVECQLQQFEQLSKVLTPKGIITEFFQIPSDINIPLIKSKIVELAERLKQEGVEVCFNASCGLRHRLLTAYEIFRTYHWPIYVIEPFSDELCWLYPYGLEQQQVEDHINISDYLTIFGARCELQDEDIRSVLDTTIESLGHKWASNAYELGPGLATLNYLATTCRKEQKLDVELSEKQQGYRELKMLIDDLNDAQLSTFENGVLTFANEAARRFANGEWLEWYVHHVVEEIKHDLLTIQDLSLGVQVYRKIGEKEVRNELDVATVVNNKLHIIECKTKGMSSDGDDTLYKLESIRDLLGGLQARAMLVSFRPLRHHDITRATDLGLALIGPDQLADLKTHLHEWFLAAGGTEKASFA